MTDNQPNPQASQATEGIPAKTAEIRRTDEELAAKARGLLNAAVVTLQELQDRELRVSVEIGSDDCDRWFQRLTVSRTTYL